MVPVVVVEVSRSGVSHLAPGAVSSCRRTDFGKICRPYSLLESDPEYNALWNTLGLATEIMMDWHTVELIAPDPTTYGCGMPSLIAPGQNARDLLALIDRMLHDEVHVKVSSPSIREGVIHGRGRAPYVVSSEKEERTRYN